MYATSTHTAAGVKPASNDAIIVPNGGLFFSRRLKLQRLLVKEKMIIKYNLGRPRDAAYQPTQQLKNLTLCDAAIPANGAPLFE
jgi:hypothetical protein